MSDDSSALWTVLALVALAGFAVLRERHAAQRAGMDLAASRDLAARLSRLGPWTGAWLVAIPWDRRAGVMDQAEAFAAQQRPATDIVRLWSDSGARLVTHIAGPDTASEEEASRWLSDTSEKLEREVLSHVRIRKSEALFALLYACGKLPALGASSVLGAGNAVLEADCFGVAFVSCLAGRKALWSDSIEVAARAAFAAVAVLMLILAALPAISPHRPAPLQVSAASASSPASASASSPALVPTPEEAGAPEAGTPEQAVTGTALAEAGAPDAGEDARSGPDDAGSGPDDAGSVAEDAGSSPKDTSLSPKATRAKKK